MNIYEAVDVISGELSQLITGYFDPTEYPELDFTSDAFNRRMKRALFDLLHECNRKDLPESARVPFLEWVINQALVDAYEAEVISPDYESADKQRPTNSASIKSTSVSFGKSDYEILRDDRKAQYAGMQQKQVTDWEQLTATLRKLRW